VEILIVTASDSYEFKNFKSNMFRLETNFPSARLTEESEHLPILQAEVPPVVEEQKWKNEGTDILVISFSSTKQC